jgi:dienelactone hydrolase
MFLKLIRTLAPAVIALALGGVCFAGDRLPEPNLKFAPPSGNGPLLVMFSGNGGPYTIEESAQTFAKEGYVVAVIDTTEFYSLLFIPDVEETSQYVRGLIGGLLKMPEVTSTKSVVIGYSLGGRIALGFANRMPDLVASVVAYYPATIRSGDPLKFLTEPKLTVPTLFLQGEKDFAFLECCNLKDARILQGIASSPSVQAPMELFEYPEARHGFNINRINMRNYDRKRMDNMDYRQDDDIDSVKRTLAHFKKHSTKII